jgi:hypothetical protein
MNGFIRPRENLPTDGVTKPSLLGRMQANTKDEKPKTNAAYHISTVFVE